MLRDANQEFVETLKQVLPPRTFKEPEHRYFEEPRGRWTGRGVVLAPANTAEVATIVKACAQSQVAIVPYGGGTGLVGGQLKNDGPVPVVLSVERMSQIRGVYPQENVLVCDAGVILADLQREAEAVGRLFPLSLASEGSARIGGLLATNAGGVNVLRYGNTRAQCLGLEVVLADGTIWNGLSRLRKDNTGYDLRDLMIGSEGTLGIITGAALKMVPRPRDEGAAMLSVPSPQAALDLLALAGDMVGEGISAFELMHRQGFDFLEEVGPEVTKPLSNLTEWTVLIDLGLSSSGMAEEGLAQIFEAAFERGLVSDGVVAQTLTQRQAFWSIRENIPIANRRIGSVSSHDISLPLSAIPTFVTEATAALTALADFRINCFGHLGDGNLHFNVFPAAGKKSADYEALRPQVKRLVHDLVHQMEGSVSAEHGIGRLKVDDLERYGDPAKLAMMRAIKEALDPKGIMNPGTVLRSA